MATADASPEPDIDSPPQRVKVLIVDDQRLARITLKTMLHEARERLLLVGEAEEGREAIALCEKLRPDVVLMDIGMPVLDGIRATLEIRRRFPDIKVVMLTTHDSEADILESFRSGATSYCLKDTPPLALAEILTATAGGACYIDPRIARVVLKGIQPADGPSPQPENTEPTVLATLTDREIDVLKLIAQGKNNTEIAEQLCLSMNTVKTHIKNIFQKLEVEDRTAAALKALRERII